MSTNHTVRRLVVWVLAVGLPSVATAQDRSGFWANFGVGIGSGGISAETVSGRKLEGGRDIGPAMDLGFGWAVNRRLLAGIDFRGTAGTLFVDARRTFVAMNVVGIVTYYPKNSSNLFIQGGLGGSFVGVDQDPGPAEQIESAADGFGFTIGAGYDVYLGRGFSVSPAVLYWYGHPGDVQVQGQTLLKNWRHDVVAVVVSLKFN